MLLNQTAPAQPGFIDRIRELIAKVFGPPARKPQGAESADTEDLANTARPGADAPTRASVLGKPTTTP
jgi:hypothetical protein